MENLRQVEDNPSFVQIIHDCDVTGDHFHYQVNGWYSCMPGHPTCKRTDAHPMLGDIFQGREEDCPLCTRHWVGVTKIEGGH